MSSPVTFGDRPAASKSALPVQSPLRVTAYDQVASMIIALLLLVGTGVLVMLILWWTSKVFARPAPVPVVPQAINEPGFGDPNDLETPNVEGTDEEEIEVEETLAAVADAVATKLASLDEPTFTNESRPGRSMHGTGGRGGRRGFGSERQWEVRFGQGYTLDAYARQLDYFKIELGVLTEDGQVEYASNLSRPTPTRRVGPAEAEKRYYLTWRRGDLQEADRELLRKAGIDPQGRLILKFLTPEVENMLAGLERQRAGSRAQDVRGTRYAVVPQGSGWAFSVESQTYWHLRE